MADSFYDIVTKGPSAPAALTKSAAPAAPTDFYSAVKSTERPAPVDAPTHAFNPANPYSQQNEEEVTKNTGRAEIPVNSPLDALKNDWGNIKTASGDIASSFWGGIKNIGSEFTGSNQNLGQRPTPGTKYDVTKNTDKLNQNVPLNFLGSLPGAAADTLTSPFTRIAAQVRQTFGGKGVINPALLGLHPVESYSKQVDKDVNNGVPLSLAVMKQVPNVIFDTLFVTGEGRRVFGSKEVPIAQSSNKVAIPSEVVGQSPKPSYIPISKENPAGAEVHSALQDGQYKNYNSDHPTFLKVTPTESGFKGEIVQVKPGILKRGYDAVFGHGGEPLKPTEVHQAETVVDPGTEISKPELQKLQEGTKPMPDGRPVPFAGSPTGGSLPVPNTAQPFANEAGNADRTQEPFSGKVYNQLPDRVVQHPDGGFHTIPIDQAHSVMNGIPNSSIVEKSPGQMAATGQTNLGPAYSGEIPTPTVGPETSTALKEVPQGMSEADRQSQAGFINPGAPILEIKKAIDNFKAGQAKQTDAMRLRVQFTGNADERIAKDNYLFKSLSKIVSNPTDRQVLSIYRAFKNDPQGLRQFFDGTNPFYDELAKQFAEKNPKASATDVQKFRQEAVNRVRKYEPLIRGALTPNEPIKAVDKALTDYSKNKLAEGQEKGFLDSTINPENYVPQFTRPKGLKEQFALSGGRLGSKFLNALKRDYLTPLHAIADGATPKSLDAIENFKVYAERHANAAATIDFLNQLKDQQLAAFNSENAPKDWESVMIGRGRMVYLPADMAEAVKPLIDANRWSLPGWLQNIKAYQAYVKSVEVSLSVFHAKALTITAVSDIGPKLAATAPFIDQDSPAFKSQELDGLKHGLKTPILGQSIEARKFMERTGVPTRSELMRGVPGVKQVMQLSDKLTQFTFDIDLRNYKVASFSTKAASWMAKHPGATVEEIYNAKVDIAKQVNSVYGGLNWQALGVSSIARAIAQVFVFAPDWTWSNILSGKYSFQGGPAGSSSRSFWLKAMLGGLIATQLASLLITGKMSKKPFQVYQGLDKNGKEVHSNWFFVGGPGDLTKWVDNVQKDGAIMGTVVTFGNKTQAFIRALVHVYSGKNYQGQDIKLKGASPIVNDARTALEIISETSPIPFSVSGVVKTFTNPQNQIGFWDYANTILGGTTTHDIPAGDRQVPSGKKKGQIVPDKNANRPQKSFLDQIRGTSIYQPKGRRR